MSPVKCIKINDYAKTATIFTKFKDRIDNVCAGFAHRLRKSDERMALSVQCDRNAICLVQQQTLVRLGVRLIFAPFFG